jgi:hypothetical protein
MGIPAPYNVWVYDNFHYMDEDDRDLAGAFADCAAAVVCCQGIVEASLRALYRPGMAAKELFEQYTSFGDDASISSPDRTCTFSAWTFAERRSAEICEQLGTAADGDPG